MLASRSICKWLLQSEAARHNSGRQRMQCTTEGTPAVYRWSITSDASQASRLTCQPHVNRLREGRRVPHSLGDAPTWQFGSRLKGTWDAPADSSPGPVYRADTALGPGTAPVYKMAPRFGFGQDARHKRGLRQGKNAALKV